MDELINMGWKQTRSGKYTHPTLNERDGRKRLVDGREALRIQKRMDAEAERSMEMELRKGLHDALTRPLTDVDGVRARMNLWNALGNPWGALMVKSQHMHIPGVSEL